MPMDGTGLRFPHFTVLRASAGSGKTYALARRFVLFLLSDSVRPNRLGNLLAITFSNNAAKEMKERILFLLKQLHLGDRDVTSDFARDLSLPEPALSARAGEVIEDLLSHYSDFQIKTIDSFMTTVFKASAIDFGYNPDFEILMSNESLMGYAFELFLRRVREGTEEARLMGDVTDIITENAAGDSPYPFEATGEILAEIEEIYRKVAACGKPVRPADYSAAIDSARRRITDCIEGLEALITASSLVKSKSSSYGNLLKAVRAGRFADIIGKGMKTVPVCMPRTEEGRDPYLRVVGEWEHLGGLIAAFTRLFACTYYTPYLRTYEAFSAILERVKRHEGKVFIEDVNRRLAEYLDGEIVPDVYFRLGEAIFHYLVDEFQDTSPIQWRNLLPLIENSLSQGGSLFVVGDTKQAIYGFRDADYRIMRGIEAENPFPSSLHNVEELHTNYRSDGAVVAFSEHIFQRVLPEIEGYREAGRASGLLTYRQTARAGKERCGFVETCLLQRDDREPPERERLYELLSRLLDRGYRRSDVAILTNRNDDVVKVTAWLNAKGIPFVSYSSLDIRRRKITGEIIALLSFLDSPLDDLSFATFILGDIMNVALERRGEGADVESLHEMCFRNRRGGRPLYKRFQEEMPGLWDRYFDGLFRLSGYLPLYDLVVEIYRVFEVFSLFGNEEAALSRILEVVKDLEAEGGGSLRSFLQAALLQQSDDADWNIGIPAGIDAVKVMTVHKAKGLGFPVVILLLYGERSKGFRYIVEEHEGSVALLRLTKGMLQADRDFEGRYRDEETKDKVSRLNSLYVAFTRAGSELYVLGVKGGKDSFPFVLLPDGTSNFGCESPLAPPERADGADEWVEGFHHTVALEGAGGPEGPMRHEEKKRGEIVHRVLSAIDYVDGDAGAVVNAAATDIRKAEGPDAVPGRLEAAIAEFLREESVAAYFERRPGRVVMQEQELADSSGRLFRLDRLIVDPETITVFEYKTGGEENDERHLSQMRNYLRLIGEIYRGRKIEGLIAYVDAKSIREVR